MNYSRVLYLLLCLLLTNSLLAQKSLIYTIPDKDYVRASELFEKQKYSAASHFFDKVVQNQDSKNTIYGVNAEYYSAICALELFHPDAEYRLITFIKNNPVNSRSNEAVYALGKFYYNTKKFPDAAEWLAKVDPAGLDEDVSAEYHFIYGYSCFMNNDFDKARAQFFEIKDKDTKYTAAAVYYYSHILYEQKNYESALEGFMRLRDDETFSAIVPYYITHIYFLQKKYDKVVEYAPPLLNSVIEKRVGEMSRIIGESYYKLGKYNESLPYFDKFVQNSSSISLDDKYEIGYAYYKSKDVNNAIKYFEPVATDTTALAQNALYHLADCYLQTGNKQKARLAFSTASTMNYDASIKESSLFNYAIVTYELSLCPFNEAIKAFEEYLLLYPYSNRVDEAYNYLVLAYLSTRNYKAALESIEKVKNKNTNVQRAYQRITFFRGLELFNNSDFDKAIVLFDKSLEYSGFDKQLVNRANYWKAEAYYRLGTFPEALRLYNLFITAPGAESCNEYKMIYYNIGYCHFNLKNYETAIVAFKKYTEVSKNKKSKVLADAYNRIGDCDFMKPAYWLAIDDYDKAISLNNGDVDYSLFQKGFAYGLVSRQEKKISTLNQLLTDFPASSYADDALFEIGRANVVLNASGKAIEAFNKILVQYSTSNYVPKALIELGLIYYNEDKDQEAIGYFKQVIEKYSGTEEARKATQGLKNVYVGMNDVDTYFAYMKNSGNNVDIRSTEQDSLSYVAAENVYMSGNCDKSTLQFKKYIQNFPNGSFVINANFYIADCSFRNSKPEDAISGYEYVINAPRSMFTEQALSALSQIYFNKEDYKSALALYKQLDSIAEVKSNIWDAKVGQMRCYFKLSDNENAITTARNILSSSNNQEDIQREAHYICGKSLLAMDKTDEAIKELYTVSRDVKSKEGAEARYLLVKTYYDKNKKDLAEKEIFDFIQKGTPYSFWLGKSFLLLSDIYVDKNDDFQAVQTLQSIIEYYEVPDDGIISEAKSKKEIISARTTGSQNKKEQDVEINLNNQKLQ
jgi:TolA-binding protein